MVDKIVPDDLNAMLQDNDPAKVERVMKALVPMKKLDLCELQRAYGSR
jgi:hypothetical protein